MNNKPDDGDKRNITYIPQLYINYLAAKDNKEELNSLVLNILLQNEIFKTEYHKNVELIKQTTNLIDSNFSKMRESYDSALQLNKEYREIGDEKSIQKSIDNLNLQINQLTKQSTLSKEELELYNKLRTNGELLIKQRQKVVANIELSNKVYSEIYNSFTGITGTYDENGTSIKYGKIDNLYNQYADVPESLIKLKDDLVMKSNNLLNDINAQIKSLDFDKEICKIDAKIKEQGTMLEPLLKKIQNLEEVKKIQELSKNEIIKLGKSKEIKAKLDAALQEYRNTQSEVGDLLDKRYLYYVERKDYIAKNYSTIGGNITLDATVVYPKSAFTLHEQVNKNKIFSSHPFCSLFIENEVNYKCIPTLFKNIFRNNTTENIIELKDKSTEYPLNQGVPLFDVYKGMILDAFEISFEIKYLNDSLLKMSPGKKGTVLLILFLQISSSDYPILIDQPEDNLDNRTIYDLLCQMIRTKKVERQIIIVSHNANLVVATDSENIIVANQQGQVEGEDDCNISSRFEYVNGALELSFISEKSIGVLYQKGIKEHACDILEGGTEAFKHREKKYSLNN